MSNPLEEPLLPEDLKELARVFPELDWLEATPSSAELQGDEMKDRRAIWLAYPYETKIVNHLCAPGLAPAVRKYVETTYGHRPKKISRHRSGYFDPGGMLMNCNDTPVRVQLDGWSIRIMPSKIPHACMALEDRLKRGPKLYGDHPVYRWQMIYGMLLLRRSEAEAFLTALKPLAQREALRRDVALEELSQCRHVLVPGRPRPAGEA